MKRRSFLKSMLAVPVVGLAAKGKSVVKPLHSKSEKLKEYKCSENIVDFGSCEIGNVPLYLGVKCEIRGSVELITSKESDFSNSKVIGGGLIKPNKACYFKLDGSRIQKYIRARIGGDTVPASGSVQAWLCVSPTEPERNELPIGRLVDSTLDLGDFV